MRILLINDTSSSPNWGARATSFALKKMISETGDHSIVNINQDNIRDLKRPDNFINKSKNILKLLIPPLGFKIKEKLLPALSYPGNSEIIPKKWEDFDSSIQKVTNETNNFLSKELQAIQRADLVVVQGEGSIRNNTFQSRMMLFLGYVAKKHFNKPVIIVNHTADFSHPELYKIAANVYPLFDDVVFREPTSAQRASEFCNGRIGGDTAFIFKPVSRSKWLPVANRMTYFNFWPDKANFDPAKPYICIGGGSGLPSGNNDRYDPVSKLSILITHLKKQLPYQIVLTVSGPTDERIFRSLAQEYNLPLLGLTIPIQQAVDILGNSKAYIGGRWHSSIFALSGGAPIIPFTANTFKMEALSNLFGLSDYIVNPQNMDSEKHKIVQMLTDYFNQGDDLRRMLQHRAQEEAQKAKKNVDFLLKNENADLSVDHY